ncbi:MAG: putative unusual protein kinase [Rhodobacteraceae bacterium HLUCCA08]|nr:MAG: putative unusual protein kinase [Rhodobacteraceae bacterium HLUCCA08]
MSDTPERPAPRAVPAHRLGRLARLGSLGLGVAGAMALGGAGQLLRGQRPSGRDLLLTPGNIGRITDELARMRGAAMKVGQMISMDAGDVLPPELARIMARLRAEADIMPPRQLKSVLEAAWGPGWLSGFARFDPRPVAAASIGQVHRAVLTDGRDVAIKVQYPGIARSIDSDVANVGALIRMSGLVPKGLDLAPLLDEARLQLHEETDYRAEAAHLEQFRTLLADDPRFALPQPVDALTTAGVLCMTWLDGPRIETLQTAPQTLRDRIAKDLIDLFLAELFRFGLVQSDPNFANYLYLPDNDRIGLLDFGATRRIDPSIAACYRDLLRAGLTGDPLSMEAAARALGLLDDSLWPDHRTRLLAMMQDAFTLLRAETVDFTDRSLARRMQEQGLALAEDGFAPPPPPADVLFVQRKIGGLYLLAARLGARVKLRALLAPWLD